MFKQLTLIKFGITPQRDIKTKLNKDPKIPEKPGGCLKPSLSQNKLLGFERGNQIHKKRLYRYLYEYEKKPTIKNTLEDFLIYKNTLIANEILDKYIEPESYSGRKRWNKMDSKVLVIVSCTKRELEKR